MGGVLLGKKTELLSGLFGVTSAVCGGKKRSSAYHVFPHSMTAHSPKKWIGNCPDHITKQTLLLCMTSQSVL